MAFPAERIINTRHPLLGKSTGRFLGFLGGGAVQGVYDQRHQRWPGIGEVPLLSRLLLGRWDATGIVQPTFPLEVPQNPLCHLVCDGDNAFT